MGKRPLKIAPGQSRPLSFEVAKSTFRSMKVSLEVTYKLEHLPETFRTRAVKHIIHSRKMEEPQKITYLHPGGIVSYAILRPPSEKALRHVHPDISLPVVLGLHGAGVETDSDMVRHAFDGAPDLRGWVLFPSGVTTWCGDDWRRCALLLALS